MRDSIAAAAAAAAAGNGAGVGAGVGAGAGSGAALEPVPGAVYSVGAQRLAVTDLGRTLVLAPHPDDETLGCGGLLALLASAGAAVCVVLMTDGAGSHRQSRGYPAARLSALRQQEMTAALRELGLGPQVLVALGLPDGHLPTHGESGFAALVKRLARIIGRFRPNTVLMPRGCDAHADHRATHAAGTAATMPLVPRVRCIEYPVWGDAEPSSRAWRLDISTVLDNKRRALAQHRSQLGHVISDDPEGFTLPPELVNRCLLPFEMYFAAYGDVSTASTSPVPALGSR